MAGDRFLTTPTFGGIEQVIAPFAQLYKKMI
jgi:hypothetical protein